MKIAIDKEPLISGHKVRGIGVHTKELIEAIKHTKDKSIKLSCVDFGKSDLSKYDVVHYPNFHPFFSTLPSNKQAKKVVVTIHDLIPLIYPVQYPPGVKGRINFVKQKLRLKYIDAIITISETSKKDICRFLGVSPKKVHVIHLAPKKIFKKIEDEKFLSFIKKKYDLPESFVLYVGDVNYNKNMPTLLKACKKAGKNLVICGTKAKEIENMGIGLDVLGGPQDWIRFLFDIPHPENAHYKDLLDMFKNGGKIQRPGFVFDEELVAMYNLATVYVQPSFYEGFGLPLLEAFSCGIPVIASKIQVHKEIADDAAMYFDVENVNKLSEEINKLFKSENKRKEMVKRGIEKSKEYSWSKVARETIKVYKKV